MSDNAATKRIGTFFKISKPDILLLRSAFAKIANGNLQLQPGRVEVLYGTMNLLLWWSFGCSIPKDTAQ